MVGASWLLTACRLDRESGQEGGNLFESSLREAPLKISTGHPSALPDVERLRAARPVATLRGRNRSKAEVRVYDLDGRRIVLKDYGVRPAWIRWTLGGFLVRRETAAYRDAGAVEGLPRCLGRVGRWALALEWIDGRPLAEWPRDELPPGTFERLDRIIRSLHERGVALADLHHRDVLIGVDGGVHVVDLAAAWSRGRGGLLRRWIFDRLCEQDRVALERLRARAAGEDPDAAVLSMGGRAAAWHRLGRRLKHAWDRLRGRRQTGDGASP
jgi:hypothetical protein